MQTTIDSVYGIEHNPLPIIFPHLPHHFLRTWSCRPQLVFVMPELRVSSGVSEQVIAWGLTGHVTGHTPANNPRPAGGGGQILPPPLLPDFLDSSNTAANIDVKLSVASPAWIWRLPAKFQKIPSRNFWENGVLVTSCPAILGKKKQQMFEGC